MNDPNSIRLIYSSGRLHTGTTTWERKDACLLRRNEDDASYEKKKDKAVACTGAIGLHRCANTMDGGPRKDLRQGLCMIGLGSIVGSFETENGMC